MAQFVKNLLTLTCISITAGALPAFAQHNTEQLEQMLDSVGGASGFSQGGQSMQSGQMQGQMQNQMQGQVQSGNGGQYQQQQFNQGQVMQHPFMNQGNNNWQQQRSVPTVNPGQTMQSMQQGGQGPFAKINRARQMMNGQAQAQEQQQQPRGFGGIFKTMFGDSADYGSGDASGNASRAQTQAGIARNAASSSYYGDHWSRSQNADTAYYAAAEARREADAAYYKMQSANADASTRGYYATARAAADSAQAAADTARGNADRTYK